MQLNPDMKLNDPLSLSLAKLPTREGFGKALAALGEQDQSVVALTADVAESVRVHYFAEKFPARFIQCGVAEQSMAGVAAGLAYSGKIPFMAAYGVFNPGRNFDQIRVAICYAKANVKIAASHTGLTVGPDGATHQALEDLALVRSLPGITVFSPSDSAQAYKATVEAHKLKGPVYLRLCREKFPIFTTEETPFITGKANLLVFGSDITIAATGPLVHEALLAAAELEKQGIRAEVIDFHTLSHNEFDHSALEKSARNTGCVLTVEEHQIVGGLGSAVCESLSEHYPVPVKRLGMNLKFGQSGEGYELLKHYGLWHGGIAESAKNLVSTALKR